MSHYSNGKHDSRTAETAADMKVAKFILKLRSVKLAVARRTIKATVGLLTSIFEYLRVIVEVLCKY